MKFERVLGRLMCILLVVLLTACQNVQKFKEKVVTETQKTMHFTKEPNHELVTMEELIDNGQLSSFVFNDEVYNMQTEIAKNEVGRAIGSVGQIYYIDQHGKRWTTEELKQPYVYENPKQIREKKPLQYGLVYQYKAADQSEDTIVIQFNHKYIKATQIPVNEQAS